MSTHKHIDKICCIVLAFTLIFATLFCFAESFGVEASIRALGYENKLFSTDKVHTVDIIIDDWDSFVSTAQSEQYSVCSVVIDGEPIKNVGIRGKGNTSLSTVSSMGSQRYSFKIEFDQYDNTKTYHGLDKLCLNNVIQDNTYMKDYLVYQMMNSFGVSAPLCSFAYITVNGEDWGLYLAVEAVEDSFLQRNYGSNYGELYKPDSMSFGGGRGNGKDFDMSDFMGEDGNFNFSFDGGNMPNMGNMFTPDASFGDELPDESGASGSRPSRGEGASFGGGSFTFDEETLQYMMGENGSFEMPDMGNMGGFGGMGGFGMGSSDVKLQYIDDNASSYSNIFNNAKTDITKADQNRLIASLKQLSEYTDVEEVVDIEKVLRYFVVHNFTVNSDSYTGSMIHNYYLYEDNGQLSMIPWDYNLAFGTFQGSNASSSVNSSISEVLSDRPMQAWIFSNETYSEQYYKLYNEFIETVDMQAIIDNAYALIAPYVEKDPTAFCTYDEFEVGVDALTQFCTLRSESVRLQLADSEETVDASELNISAMGTMGGGFGGGGGGGFGDFGGGKMPSSSDKSEGDGTSVRPQKQNASSEDKTAASGSQMPWGGGQMPNMGDFNMEDFASGDFNMGEFNPENMPQGGMNFPGNSQSGSSQKLPQGSIGSANTSFSLSDDLIMMIVCAVVLAGGITFAALFKRRR